MSGFLTRLAERTLGLAPRADARPVSRYEPDAPMPEGRSETEDDVAGADILAGEGVERPDHRGQPTVRIERTSTAPAERRPASDASPRPVTRAASDQPVPRRRQAPSPATPPHAPPPSAITAGSQAPAATEHGRSPPPGEPGPHRRQAQSSRQGAHPSAPPARARAEIRRAETPLRPAVAPAAPRAAVPDVAVSVHAPAAQGEPGGLEVTIERIDVRVPPPAAPETRRGRAAALDRIPSLSDYLARRRE